jgi:ubiquinone/menaquinone biosynthesis C-methylase UbiE
MTYSAKTVYRNDSIAVGYEHRRFRNWAGRLSGDLEKSKMLAGLEHLGVRQNSVVLDVPAGTGRLTRAAIEHGYQTIGVDVSSAMLRQGFVLHGLDHTQTFVGAVAGDIESLPLTDRSVDAVLSLRLMGHLPKDAKARALREMLRVARVGVVVMFARRTPFLRVKREALWWLGMRPRAQHWFDETEQDIHALVSSAGGEVVGYQDLLGPFAESRAYAIRSKRCSPCAS